MSQYQACLKKESELVNRVRELEYNACNQVTRRFFYFLWQVWGIREHQARYIANMPLFVAISTNGLIKTMGSIDAARRLMNDLSYTNHMQRYVLYKRFSYLKTLREVEQHWEIRYLRNRYQFMVMPLLTTLRVCGGRGFLDTDIQHVDPLL